MSNYPNSIDGYAQIPFIVNKETAIKAVSLNNLRSAIINIEE